MSDLENTGEVVNGTSKFMVENFDKDDPWQIKVQMLVHHVKSVEETADVSVRYEKTLSVTSYCLGGSSCSEFKPRWRLFGYVLHCWFNPSDC